MQSRDKYFTKATFLTKSKNQTVIKKVSDINNNKSEGSPSESCDDSDTSSDNESLTNMEGDGTEIETTKKNNCNRMLFLSYLTPSWFLLTLMMLI